MITKEQETLIFIALGEASMSWVERPKGEFDSVNCERIGNELIKKLNQLKQQKMTTNDLRVEWGKTQPPKTYITDYCESLGDDVFKDDYVLWLEERLLNQLNNK